MYRTIALTVAALSLPGIALAGESRIVEGRAKLAPGQEVRLDFPVGELEVEGVAGDQLFLEVEGRCKHRRSRCEDYLEAIEIDMRESRGRLSIEVVPHSKWRWWDDLQLEGRMTFPADHALLVDMGVGELDVEGLRADLEVDLGVGEISVDMEVAGVRSVYLDAGIGETELLVPDGWVRGERSFLVGSETSWRDGPGDARVHLEVGVGEIVLRLDE